MPIYECHCMNCELTFEVLARVGEFSRGHACPGCRRLSPRIASTFAIVAGGRPRDGGVKADAQPTSGGQATRRGKRRPLCLQHPHIPLLCHMDEASAERWVAHYNGQGAEYDDKRGESEELRRKRGLPPAPAPSEHAGHFHKPPRHEPIGVTKGKAASIAANQARGKEIPGRSHNGRQSHTAAVQGTGRGGSHI